MTAASRTQTLPWAIIVAGSLIAMITFGPRSAMGFFQLPLLADTGWDRQTFGFAMALQNLFWGVGQPFFGAFADKYGTARVLIMSAIFYAAGLLLMAHPSSPAMLHLGGGVLIGLSIGFVVRIVFSTMEMAGQLAGLQMGLGFASFYDPQHAANTGIVAQFLGLFMLLVFLAFNGHLIVLRALIESFVQLPIGSGSAASSKPTVEACSWTKSAT